MLAIKFLFSKKKFSSPPLLTNLSIYPLLQLKIEICITFVTLVSSKLATNSRLSPDASRDKLFGIF